jgi:signal transduction histidine kinase
MKLVVQCLAPLALCALATTTWASCIGVDTPELQSIDRLTDAQPALAVTESQRLIEAAGPAGDPWVLAQLHSIQGEAVAEQSHLDAAEIEVNTARTLLARAPGTATARRLSLRIDLLEQTLKLMRSDALGATRIADKLLADGPAENSLERACVLAARAQAYMFMNQADRGAADALAAYRIAVQGGWTDAHIEAAYTLAQLFRRAGLYEQAQQMIDDVVGIAMSEGRDSLLSTAQYERAQLFVVTDRFAEAQTALETARSVSARLGDKFGVASVNAPLCWAEINQGDFDAAERTCYTGLDELRAGGRDDLVRLMQAYQARIDFERHRYAAALAKFDTVIGGALHEQLPVQEPQFYRDRARVYRALGRDAAAYDDLNHAFELDRATGVEQRNREVAVLSALVTSEKLSAANRILEERVEGQRKELASQHVARRLWTTLSVAAALLCLMFAYLLHATRRHGRELRRQETILRSAGNQSPDALVLLDESRRVRFANRNLFDHGAPHPHGERLGAGVPAAVLPVLEGIVAEACEKLKMVTRSVAVEHPEGNERKYELTAAPAIDNGLLVGLALRSTDVTDVRRLEREVLDGASRERQRLSDELHEGLGQELAGVLMLLGSASTVIERGLPDAGDLVRQVAQYVVRSIETTRELARGLSPVRVGYGSLAIALAGLVEETRAARGIQVTSLCRLQGVVLADVAADHLYRFCRDAIEQAAGGSASTRIDVTISVDVDDVQVRIDCDGNAFHDEASGGEELEMKMLAYRTLLLGGTLRVTHGPSGGARLTMSVPITQVEAVIAEPA